MSELANQRYIDGALSFTTAPTTLALSVASARTGALAVGLWELWCPVACFFLVGVAGAVVADTSSIPLAAATVKLINIEAGNTSVAGILAASTSTLFLTPRVPR